MSLLDWNSIENSRHGITDSLKGPSKFSRERCNDHRYLFMDQVSKVMKSTDRMPSDPDQITIQFDERRKRMTSSII